jgi:hypothetical protein
MFHFQQCIINITTHQHPDEWWLGERMSSAGRGGGNALCGVDGRKKKWLPY